MDVSELTRRYRFEANDLVQPYFVSDAQVLDLLNDAQVEACVRGRLLFSNSEPSMTKINLVPSVSKYKLHQDVYEVTSVWLHTDGWRDRKLMQVSPYELDNIFGENWRELEGKPEYLYQTDTEVIVVPTPNRECVLTLDVFHTPTEKLVESSDEPIIHKAHHIHLIQWVLHKAFSIPDSEFFDPNRSQLALQSFEKYFGLRPDSDLRRVVNSDKPHNVKPFLP